MEMVVSSVEMHKLNATDKELPIQFCGEREMGPGRLKIMLLLLAAKDKNIQGVQTSHYQFIAIRAPHVHQHIIWPFGNGRHYRKFQFQSLSSL